MAKKKGETTTTVSVGIRIDPKIKFALDMMGRQQKRSLTAVVEWAISNAIAQQASTQPQRSFSDLVDLVWSTDESTRFANMAFYMPTSLTFDELRIWETVEVSACMWYGSGDIEPERFNYHALRKHWAALIEHVEKHKHSPTIQAFEPTDPE